ncbi:MAG: cell division protein [Alphaproteobacteria bacterium]|jgi:cell division transport system permease protein|nr:cell division protein [Rhodospirillaceae bacterium]MDP6405334.1 cell division protein [Alphaproteobacteria bacterium]MDP6622296.1 cell division protein [Alphaproteobacteria bacterium]
MVLRRRRDLPLERDGSGRFLPWTIALMVYLAALALTGALLLDRAVERWSTALGGTLTVQVAAITGPGGGAETAARVATAASVLRRSDAVAEVRVLSRAEIVALVEPWLGRGNISADLPLPRLIDVTLEADSQREPGDLGKLAESLAAAVPGSRVDDHKVWMSGLLRLARTSQFVALTVVVLIAVAAATTVIFATNAGLAVHHEVIEVLHLIGAHDTYVARQFQGHAVSLALRGGTLGLILAALTIAVLWGLAGEIAQPMLPHLEVDAALWGALATLPLGAAAIAAATARTTVLRALRRMP